MKLKFKSTIQFQIFNVFMVKGTLWSTSSQSNFFFLIVLAYLSLHANKGGNNRLDETRKK